MRIPPIAAAFATAVPVMPAKIMLDTILTWDRFPVSLPTIKLAKTDRSRVMVGRVTYFYHNNYKQLQNIQ